MTIIYKYTSYDSQIQYITVIWQCDYKPNEVAHIQCDHTWCRIHRSSGQLISIETIQCINSTDGDLMDNYS